MLISKILEAVQKVREPFLPGIEYSRRSFSQEGEDLVLSRALDRARTGFYVDVGAHHPFRFSNTYLFYRRGWRGICIDPMPGTIELFKKYRPKDLTLESGVGKESANLDYYMFNEPALNTFDVHVAEKKASLRNCKIVGKKKMPVVPLSKILDTNLPTDQEITFFSIDVEGLDLEVLRSNDWERFQPKFIIAECLNSVLASITDDEVVKYLSSVGYTAFAKTGNSLVFKIN